MNRKILFLIVACLCISGLHAQEEKNRRNSYLNLSYAYQQLTGLERGMMLNSDRAAAFTIGHTYYLHRKPLFNLMKIGLDATFFDLNVADYGKYYEKHYGFGGEEEEEGDLEDMSLQLEVGMHIGPSITFLPPVKGLKGNIYFRYAPSISAFKVGDDLFYNYAGLWVSGLAVSYKVISAGMELRWGSADYKVDEYTEKWQTKATRYYISFRF
ncbi:MAG: hypothetical protein LBN11_00870 [Tannerella sp.]|jgi:hypothetical protein|nr:hypothetical protein [Tannerella sp.]